jgi:ATP-dependent RNA helicase DeaD
MSVPSEDVTLPANSPQTQHARDGRESDSSGFAALGLGPEALRAIEDLGYGAPTPIQDQTIALLLAGRDVIAQAPTGTGKTAAYGLPIVERLDVAELRPQALVLSPTRELAVQVSEALHALGKYREMVSLPIYGGVPYERQFRALARGVQVVVGTPGRLLDHLRRETLDLSHVRFVVLDEADEMLDMGFIEDIETILQALPAERQSALFSATIPPRVARLAEAYLREPERVSVAAREAVAPKVRQVYYEVAWPEKAEALARILDYEQPESAIVFVRTRRDADEVAERLSGLGYLALAIHGDLNQVQRERALDRFREGRTQLLVATDVAARGLDIPDVSHVINYDLPEDADAYVHRIGRTGRAGRSGEALTLVTPRERRQLMLIERLIHRRLQQLRLPTDADLAARRRAAFREELLAILDGGQLDPYLGMVEDLAETRDPAELAAAAFKLAALARESSSPRPARRDGTTARPAPVTARPQRRTPVLSSQPAAAPSSLPLPEDHSISPVPEDVAPEARQPAASTAASDHAPAPVLPERAPGRERPGRAGRVTRATRGDRTQRGASLEWEDRAEHLAARQPARRDTEHPPVGDGRAQEPGMARLFLRVGRRDKIRPADLVGAVANEAHVSGDAVGDIDIYDTFSFVEVPDNLADRVLRALNRTTIRGREARATLARPLEDGGRRDEELRPAHTTRAPYPPRRSPFAPRRGAGRFSAGRSQTGRKPERRTGRDAG